MQQPACNEAPHESSRALPTALELVTNLNEAQRQQLREFARKRMRRLIRSPGMSRYLVRHSPDDLVNSALEKLLAGDVHSDQGRKLPAKHRGDPELFLQWVMGTINSLLSNAVRGAEFSFPHLTLGESLGDPNSVELCDPLDAARQLANRDLRRELFLRLREQAPPELQIIIDAWELTALADSRIPRGEFDRRQVYRVRVIAREILETLSREMRTGLPADGRELLR